MEQQRVGAQILALMEEVQVIPAALETVPPNIARVEPVLGLALAVLALDPIWATASKAPDACLRNFLREGGRLPERVGLRV